MRGSGGLRGFAAVLLGVLCLAAASDPSERLADPAQEARARQIFQQVRCLVCQNESIDDSEADLAGDLRKLVREQVKAGRSDTEIKGFLTDRYGEFVLLKPSFSLGNSALWLAPFAVVLFGAILLLAQLRNRSTEAELSESELARVKSLTDDPAP